MVKKLNTIVQDIITERTFKEQVVSSAVQNVLTCKKINTRIHPDFGSLFRVTVERIWGYKRLYHTVEMIRVTAYDSEDPAHEAMLLELWDLLMPNDPLDNRITKQWQHIGFQVRLRRRRFFIFKNSHFVLPTG